jgi:hypothetical protein
VDYLLVTVKMCSGSAVPQHNSPSLWIRLIIYVRNIHYHDIIRIVDVRSRYNWRLSQSVWWNCGHLAGRAPPAEDLHPDHV